MEYQFCDKNLRSVCTVFSGYVGLPEVVSVEWVKLEHCVLGYPNQDATVVFFLFFLE